MEPKSESESEVQTIVNAIETKSALFSGINQSALIIGGLSLYNLIKAFSGDAPVEITADQAMNIVTFLGSLVIIAKRTFAENKPLHILPLKK